MLFILKVTSSAAAFSGNPELNADIAKRKKPTLGIFLISAFLPYTQLNVRMNRS
jgi:hypothetical protein